MMLMSEAPVDVLAVDAVGVGSSSAGEVLRGAANAPTGAWAAVVIESPS